MGGVKYESREQIIQAVYCELKWLSKGGGYLTCLKCGTIGGISAFDCKVNMLNVPVNM